MIKHISIWEWRHSHSKAIINPEDLSDKGKEQCFVLRWTVGAVDALHEGSGGLPHYPVGGRKPASNPRQTYYNSVK